jgi:hypothetical protein
MQGSCDGHALARAIPGPGFPLTRSGQADTHHLPSNGFFQPPGARRSGKAEAR